MRQSCRTSAPSHRRRLATTRLLLCAVALLGQRAATADISLTPAHVLGHNHNGGDAAGLAGGAIHSQPPPTPLAAAPAAPPPFTTLFEALNTDIGPYPCTRIPSGLALPDGSVLAFAECRRWVGDGCFIEGRHNDSSAQFFNRSICLRRSPDAGATWLPIQDNITQRYSANPSAVYDAHRNRTLLVFNDAASTTLYWIASHDFGATWDTPARPLLDNATGAPVPGVGGPGNSVVALPDGTLLAAVYHTQRTNPNRTVSFTNVTVMRSADAARSWEQVHLLPHLGEPSLTLLPSDVKGVGPVLVLDARCPDGRGSYPGPKAPCDCNCRGVATSTDGGVTWGSTVFDPSVPDPDCQGAVLALTNGSVVMSNPHSATARVDPALRLGEVLVRCEEEAVVVWDEDVTPLAASGTFGAYSSLFQTLDGRVGVLWETEGDEAARGCTGGSCSIVLSFL